LRGKSIPHKNKTLRQMTQNKMTSPRAKLN